MSKIKDFFNNIFNSPSEEERRIQAQIEYRTQERNFRRYAGELDKAVDKFKLMAYEAEQKGQHDNAIKCTMFTKKLMNSRDKVDSVLQRFEMLHAMKGISDMMVQFMDTCAKVGCDMKTRIDIPRMLAGQTKMAEGLNRLDYLSDQLEQVFNAIDDSAGINETSDHIQADPEIEKMLSAIRAEFEGKTANEPVPEETTPIRVKAPKPVDEVRRELTTLNQQLGELQH